MPPRPAGGGGEGGQRLYQLIQQSPNAVMLLGGSSDGLVAHGANTAHLQPLYQTPATTNKEIDIK